jgi:phenylacetate-coenzyme A ligase PaaK-like adenylate-forming protein
MKEYLTIQQLKTISWETIEKLQQQRFKATAKYLLPHVKAYRDLFRQYNVDFNKIEKVEDWKKLGLPLLKKAYYKEHPEDFVLKIHPSQAFTAYENFLQEQESAAAIAIMIRALTAKRKLKQQVKDFFTPKMPAFSAGTESGRPTPVFITAKQKQTMAKILEITGELITNNLKPEGMLVGMNLFPYAPHLGWHAVHMALDKTADLNLCTAAGGAIPTERLVEMAEAFQANIFAGMSTYLRNRWLDVAIQKRIKLPEKALFVNGADKMYEPERQKISELAKKLGVKHAVVLDFFGASELKEDLMPECAPGTGFHHIAPLSNIIRTVKAEGTAKTGWIEDWDFTNKNEGGYGVIWNIDGAGTLLEGYLIGDVYDHIASTPCKKCGLNVERIFDISRIKDTEAQLKLTGMVEAKVKGARINLVAIRDALLKLNEVAEAQVIAKQAQLIIRIAPKSSKQRAEKQVSAAITRLMLEATPKIEYLTLEKLTKENGFKFKGILIE